MVLGSSPVAVTSPASSKEFLDIQATIECGFTLKRVRDMTRTYNQKKYMWLVKSGDNWKKASEKNISHWKKPAGHKHRRKEKYLLKKS